MDYHFPIMLAATNGFIIILGLMWCVAMLALYLWRWISNPKSEWTKLNPGFKDLILGWIAVFALVGLFWLLRK